MTETHVENPADEIREQIGIVREAVRELQRVLLETSLMEEYRKAAAPLNEEDANLTAEIQALSSARDALRPRVEAMQRLSTIRVDECLAVGDHQGAAAKRAEVEELAKSLRDLGERIGRDTGRLQAIDGEKRRLAKEIFEAAYPQFPLATFSLLGAMVDLLDALKQGMFDYTQATGISGSFPDQLPKSYHIGNLTPNELPGSDRQLSRRLDSWFGPARR
jgi:DNA-binding FrmR family transcriptional regulator